MKIARVLHDGAPQWVEIRSEEMFAISGSPFKGGPRTPLGAFNLQDVLPPIEPHNKIVGLMGNWGERGDAPGSGMIIKPNSALIPNGADIVSPPDLSRVNFEGELVIVIGRQCKNASVEAAHDYIFGYTITNDVTSFSVLHEDQIDFLGQLASISMRFKMYDTFCPLGPWIVTGIDPDSQRLRTILNGKVIQDVNTAQMAYSVAEVVQWISSIMTLNPGDVICTGTAWGFVDMSNGDIIEIEVEDIGTLRNRFLRADRATAD